MTISCNLTMNNDGNGQWKPSNATPATSITTSKVTRSKKRSRETESSIERRGPRHVHVRVQTTSVAFAAATDLTSSNATGGFGGEDQDDKEEEIIRRDDRR